jgi:glycosyltransferase involved in cell wall biosynthesis
MNDARRPRVLLAISASLSGGFPTDGPRRDYVALAEATDAVVLDRSVVGRSLRSRLLARVLGNAVVQAWLAFSRRRGFDVILTDGEHIGLPLALFLKFTRSSTGHVTIGHRISAPKKWPLFRWLKLHTHFTRIALHSRRQYELAQSQLGIPPEKLALIPYQVDTNFWRPLDVAEERLICSVGLEFRDYPTLLEAVGGLDVKTVVAAASHWSKRRNTAAHVGAPPNVEISEYKYEALRDLYARSAIVVVPLDEIDFQAGITTILEAMAMGKAVIVTHTAGQTDIVEDRRAVTRGSAPRSRGASLLHTIAAEDGLQIEPTGFYVLPGDAKALRRAIVYLLEHPRERTQLGLAARRTAERLLSVERYASRLKSLIDDASPSVSASARRVPAFGGTASSRPSWT